jgi:cytochrome P450
MTASIDEIPLDKLPTLPVIKGGDRLRPRLPMDELRAEGSLLRFIYPNGVVGWLTTDAKTFRSVLGDPRFHAKRFAGEPQSGQVSVSVPEMPGFVPGMNGSEHLRVRRLAAGDFSVKHIRDLRPYITTVVDARIDAMIARGTSAELYEDFCLPVPSEVVAHILGVREDGQTAFQDAARLTIGGRAEALDDPDAPRRAVARLHEIIAESAEEKRHHPQDDLLTRLVQADPPLSREEICGLCTNLLLAGHESTSSSAALSVIGLLEQPEQLRLMLAEPDMLAKGIEELTRMRTILTDGGTSIPRLATEDIEVAGHLVHTGEWVMASNGMANTDPAVCPAHPFDLDVTRERPSSVTFGYGPHACLGQHLARAELQIMLQQLFTRLPGLTKDVPANELAWLEGGFGYRVARLPVHW